MANGMIMGDCLRNNKSKFKNERIKKYMKLFIFGKFINSGYQPPLFFGVENEGVFSCPWNLEN